MSWNAAESIRNQITKQCSSLWDHYVIIQNVYWFLCRCCQRFFNQQNSWWLKRSAFLLFNSQSTSYALWLSSNFSKSSLFTSLIWNASSIETLLSRFWYKKSSQINDFDLNVRVLEISSLSWSFISQNNWVTSFCLSWHSSIRQLSWIEKIST